MNPPSDNEIEDQPPASARPPTPESEAGKEPEEARSDESSKEESEDPASTEETAASGAEDAPAAPTPSELKTDDEVVGQGAAEVTAEAEAAVAAEMKVEVQGESQGGSEPDASPEPGGGDEAEAKPEAEAEDLSVANADADEAGSSGIQEQGPVSGPHSDPEPELDLDLDEGSVAAPIRAMRRIKLSESPPRVPQSSSPEIEATEASLDELDEMIQEEDLRDLEPTPAVADSVELESDQLKEVQEPAAAVPAPPQQAEVEELEAIEAITPEPPSAAPPPVEPFDVPPAERKPPPPRRSAKPSLPQAQKPRKKPWWETLFGDDFSRAYRAMTPAQRSREVDFIVEGLQLPRGAVILDLGCGQGEICVELAKRGYSVVGYDLSVYQLAMAGDNAQHAKQKINFLQGDMREMAFDGMFDGVICWDTTFGYFEEDKNVDVLRRVFRALKPNGRFMLDVLNRDFVAAQAPYSHWFEGDGCVCMDDMNMDWITNRMKVKRSIILDDGRSKELQYSVRLYGLSDIGRLLHEVGFRVSNVSGDVATRGAFFGPCSRRIVVQSARP